MSWAWLPVAVVALVVGFVLGVVGKRITAIKSVGAGVGNVGRSLLPLIRPAAGVAAAVALVGAGVYLANEDGDNDEWWAQGIAVAVLAFTTILLYRTLPRPLTVMAKITVNDIVYDVGTVLSHEQYDALSAENKSKVRTNRGFRALYAGLDGRWSTSKVQVVMWTYAILYGLIALFVLDELDERTEKGGGFVFSSLDLEDHQQYLLLLGGPFAAAVLAKGITTSKVAAGDVVKPGAPPIEDAGNTPGFLFGLRDVISSDSGRTDLIDFQYFLFNLLALGIFFVALVPDLPDGLPDLSEFLVGLTSASALAYVTKKGVERQKPQITSVDPPTAFPGQPVTIEGLYLAPSGLAPAVRVDKRKAEDVRIVRGGGSDRATIEARLPAELTAGDKELAVVVQGATDTATALINVAAIDVTAVEPSPIPRVDGTPVVVSGKGFGAAAGRLELDNHELAVGTWSDTRITATLGQKVPASAGSKWLRVTRGDEPAEAREFPVPTS
jgi:hypothetical protein